MFPNVFLLRIVILSLKMSIGLSWPQYWHFRLSSSYSTVAGECWSKRWRWAGKSETATCPLYNRERASLSEPCHHSHPPGGKVWGWWALAGFSPAVVGWTGFLSVTTGLAQVRDQTHSLDVQMQDKYKLSYSRLLRLLHKDTHTHTQNPKK